MVLRNLTTNALNYKFNGQTFQLKPGDNREVSREHAYQALAQHKTDVLVKVTGHRAEQKAKAAAPNAPKAAAVKPPKPPKPPKAKPAEANTEPAAGEQQQPLTLGDDK